MTWRWVWATVAGGGAAAIVVVQLRGSARLVAWAFLVAAALVVVGWKAWPPRPAPLALFGGPPDMLPSQAPRPLASIELEVAAAVDARLGGAGALRERLDALAIHVHGSPLEWDDSPSVSIDEIEAKVAWLGR